MPTVPMMASMELTVRVHAEDGAYWADVPELPGVFASGDTVEELLESLREGLALYLNHGVEIDVLDPAALEALPAGRGEGEELRIAVPA